MASATASLYGSPPSRRIGEFPPSAYQDLPDVGRAAPGTAQTEPVLCPFDRYAHKPDLGGNARREFWSRCPTRSDTAELLRNNEFDPIGDCPAGNALQKVSDRAQWFSSVKPRSA